MKIMSERERFLYRDSGRGRGCMQMTGPYRESKRAVIGQNYAVRSARCLTYGEHEMAVDINFDAKRILIHENIKQ